MVGLNKACTNAAAHSQPVHDRGSKRICTTTIFRMPPTPTLYTQTYAWSVSTRLVLMRLPVPSPSTTEDQNASALQLFSECHLRLHYIFAATYAWSVSTRLVLTRLPVPSPSTTEDQNTSALQLFSECHLSLRSPTVLPFRFPLHVVVLPPAEHTGFSSMILPNHCLCNAIPAN